MASGGTTSPSDLVLGLVRAPSVLRQDKPLGERLLDLCRDTARLLDCNRCSILLWDGEVYRGAYTIGHAKEIEDTFDQFVVHPDKPYVQELEANESFLVINDAKERPDIAGLARLADIESVAGALMVAPDGSRVGMFSAEFTVRLASFDELQSHVVLGAAQLAQSAILSDRENHRRRQLAAAVFEVGDNERRRIGRDIHDDALQRAFAVCLRLEAILPRIEDGRLREELELAIEDCHQASTALRDLANDIHPEATPAASLDEVLHRLLTRSARDQHWKFTFEDTCTEKPGNDVSRVLSRIADQAMHNIRVHAAATTVEIHLHTKDGGTQMIVTDNGRGFNTAATPRGHLGLITMRERAELEGGTFAIRSEPGVGTTVEAWIPRHGSD